MYEKTRRIKSRKHLQFVAQQRCCLKSIDFFGCTINVQAHHLLKPYDGVRGMGIRASDNNAVPLCYYHHALLHDSHGNEDMFWESFNLSKDYGREVAKKYWEMYNAKN